MAYVLSGAGASSDGDLDDRRADSALAALRAYVGYLCQDHVAPIQDEAGQPVTLPRLLAEAEGEASAPDAQQQLAGVLADYTDTILWPWDDAAPYAYPPDIYWRQAGQAWARDFGQEPPQRVLDELGDRHRGAAPRGADGVGARRQLVAAGADARQNPGSRSPTLMPLRPPSMSRTGRRRRPQVRRGACPTCVARLSGRGGSSAPSAGLPAPRSGALPHREPGRASG